MVAKRLDSPYRPGVRTKAWVKTKHFDRDWFDVLGVAPTPEERYALLLGQRSAGRPVRYVGRVEWGFTRERLEELITRGRPTKASPFGGQAPPGVVFFQSEVLAEVRYLAGSHLRHATLQSLAFEPGADGGTTTSTSNNPADNSGLVGRPPPPSRPPDPPAE